jgi:PEGA domain-containing protein
MTLETAVHLPWKGANMIPTKSHQFFSLVTLGLAFLLCAPDFTQAQQNQVMGELKFSGTTKIENSSGVWIDGQYVGYLKELKGDKKIMLLPGQHEISVRQSGYNSFTQTLVVEPRRVHILHLQMTPDVQVLHPGSDAAELKLNVKPDRAAVFVDDGYVGHAADFGGAFHSMLLSPGKHRIKVELPGYRTFETEVNLLPRQKSKVETDLVAGSILQAGPLIKEQ